MLKTMKNLYKSKREQGFTIIEVMIVLAIAAVILLIVLLAVPALQRNSRNTQRNNDAAQIAAAINTCIANHNGNPAVCNVVSPTSVDVVKTRLGQLTTINPNTATFPADTNTANFAYNLQCDPNDSTKTVSGSSRAFVVLFSVETSGTPLNRCVDS